MKSKTLPGEYISLRPLTAEDKERFYQWATHSPATPYWYGELYGDSVPDRPAFFKDWTEDYFSDTALRLKRSFAIRINQSKTEIGQVNYQLDNDEDGNEVYDIDIIIAADEHKGRGYGSEAIRVLTAYLGKTFSGVPFTIYALSSNSRAIRAYEKAGFTVQKTFSDERGNSWTKLMKPY